MIDYLYYKMYRAFLLSYLRDIPHTSARIYLPGLLYVNVLILNALLSRLHVLPFIFYNTGIAVSVCLLLITFSFAYFSDDKSLSVVERYEDETDEQRVNGNKRVISYVILTLLSVLVILII
ncbi:hypothetical protein ECE50_001255 [Chitinophaga sp. Mgbs1]|uniref:Uncharacterized protein n=1 Tax=Chitinophaga solisilvae TaxID=1233460 RepID=A0A3S1DJN4_9BACT|nr:hypothetical protein [Chitinophaga solisilvae]